MSNAALLSQVESLKVALQAAKSRIEKLESENAALRRQQSTSSSSAPTFVTDSRLDNLDTTQMETRIRTATMDTTKRESATNLYTPTQNAKMRKKHDKLRTNYMTLKKNATNSQEGYIYKKRSDQSAVVQGSPWRARYLVLDVKIKTLSYFRKQVDKLAKAPLRRIAFRDITAVCVPERGVFFDIVTTRGVHEMKATTVEECLRWAGAICMECPHANRSVKAMDSSDTPPPPPPQDSKQRQRASVMGDARLGVGGRRRPTLVPHALMLSGYLEKLSPKVLFGIKSWQRRWFVLNKRTGVLSYFKSEAAAQGSPKAAVPLALIHSVVHEGRKIHLTMVETGKIYVFQAATDMEAMQWSGAIRSGANQARVAFNLPAAVAEEVPPPTPAADDGKGQDGGQEEVKLSEQEMARVLHDVATTRTVMKGIVDFADNATLSALSLTCRDWYKLCRKPLVQRSGKESAATQSGEEEEESDGFSSDEEGNSDDEDMVPVVIDQGALTIRGGLSGDPKSGESVYVPQAVVDSGAGTDLWTLKSLRDEATVEAIVKQWRQVFKQLGLNPTKHPVLFSLQSTAPKELKKTLYELIFTRLGAPAAFIGSSAALVAYSYGVWSGLVVDLGYSELRAVPIVNGCVIEAGIVRAPHLGGRTLDVMLSSKLRRSKPESFGRLSVEEATSLAQKIRKGAVAVPDDYEKEAKRVSRKVKIMVDGMPQKVVIKKELAMCGEVYFSPQLILEDFDDSVVGIPEVIRKSVAQSPIDVRNELLGAILLTGGGSNTKNLVERLTRELKAGYSHASTVTVMDDPNRKNAIWTGGSILTTIEEFQGEWVAKWEWETQEEDNE
jgi:hypothetical protein